MSLLPHLQSSHGGPDLGTSELGTNQLGTNEDLETVDSAEHCTTGKPSSRTREPRIMNTHSRTTPRARSGFTLAEMMVVIVIIGLLATLVVPNVIQRIAVAFGGKAKADIIAIESALKEYAINNGGKYPDSLEALVTPDSNGHTYLEGKKIPKDPWKNEYLYDPPSPGHPEPRVYSYGKDGQPGGEGDDADISNETIRENN